MKQARRERVFHGIFNFTLRSSADARVSAWPLHDGDRATKKLTSSALVEITRTNAP